MRMNWLLLACSLVAVAACGGSEDPPPTEAPAPGEEPADVKAAIDLCFETLHGKVELRAEALDALRTATEAHPDNARAFYLLGLCSLAAAAEEGNISAFLGVEPAFEEAMKLDPKNTRIGGFLGLFRFIRARQFKNEAGAEAAIAELTAAAEADDFNNFTLALAFSQLDPSTGHPQTAVEKLLERRDKCTPDITDCVNNPVAPHRDQGFYMQLGDAHARVADKANAADAYATALAADGTDTWPFAAEAEAWSAALDERLSLFADGDPANDPPYFLSGARSCTGCHR